MSFEEFVRKIQDLPVIDTAVLLAGSSHPAGMKVQISRWEKSGKLLQLKRGIYSLVEPYRKINIFEYHLAFVLKNPSYISLEKALEYHHLIPESVPVYTSLTTKRTSRFENAIGSFDYRHIQTSFFWGYQSVIVNKQTAFIAFPEKALLDIIYLNHIKVTPDYLKELRLQNLEKINLVRLKEFAKRFNKSLIQASAKVLIEYIKTEQKGAKRL